jgi:hypothetical protein
VVLSPSCISRVERKDKLQVRWPWFWWSSERVPCEGGLEEVLMRLEATVIEKSEWLIEKYELVRNVTILEQKVPHIFYFSTIS